MHRRTLLAALVVGAGLTAADGRDDDQIPEAWQRSYDEEAVGRYGPALEALQGLPPRHAASYPHRLRTGWLLYLLQRYDDSARAYEEAVAQAPGAVEPRLGLLLPLMAQRRWKDAEQVARSALEIDPKNYTATTRRALSLYSLGRYKEAEAAYRSVLELYPSDLEMVLGVAWSLLKQGRTAAAEKEFRAVLELAPKNASALEGHAACRS